MAKGERIDITKALNISASLVRLLQPYCERIEVAGSVRRRRPTVGDIELLCIPKSENQVVDLFGGTKAVDSLDAYLTSVTAQKSQAEHDKLFRVRLATNGNQTFGPKNKYLTYRPTMTSVDVFTTTPERWGMTLAIRTGPKDFNVAMMNRFRERGLTGHAEGFAKDNEGHVVWMRTEDEVFRQLGWEYVGPEKRDAFAAKQPKGWGKCHGPRCKTRLPDNKVFCKPCYGSLSSTTQQDLMSSWRMSRMIRPELLKRAVEELEQALGVGV